MKFYTDEPMRFHGQVGMPACSKEMQPIVAAIAESAVYRGADIHMEIAKEYHRVHRGDVFGLGNLIPYGYPIPKARVNEIMAKYIAPELGDTWDSIQEFFWPNAFPTT